MKPNNNEFPIAQSDSGEFAVEPEFKDHRQKSLEALSNAYKKNPESVKSAIKKYFDSKPKVSLWRRVVQHYKNCNNYLAERPLVLCLIVVGIYAVGFTLFILFHLHVNHKL